MHMKRKATTSGSDISYIKNRSLALHVAYISVKSFGCRNFLRRTWAGLEAKPTCFATLFVNFWVKATFFPETPFITVVQTTVKCYYHLIMGAYSQGQYSFI